MGSMARIRRSFMACWTDCEWRVWSSQQRSKVARSTYGAIWISREIYTENPSHTMTRSCIRSCIRLLVTTIVVESSLQTSHERGRRAPGIQLVNCARVVFFTATYSCTACTLTAVRHHSMHHRLQDTAVALRPPPSAAVRPARRAAVRGPRRHEVGPGGASHAEESRHESRLNKRTSGARTWNERDRDRENR